MDDCKKRLFNHEIIRKVVNVRVKKLIVQVITLNKIKDA